MYSTFPKKDELLIRSGLASAWGFLAVSGAGGVFFPPSSITAQAGAMPQVITAGVLLVASLVAVISILWKKWRLEWIAAYFAAAGLAVYVFAVWTIVFTDQPSRLQQAASLTALIGFACYRIAACRAHAKQVRKTHEILEGKIE